MHTVDSMADLVDETAGPAAAAAVTTTPAPAPGITVGTAPNNDDSALPPPESSPPALSSGDISFSSWDDEDDDLGDGDAPALRRRSHAMHAPASSSSSGADSDSVADLADFEDFEDFDRASETELNSDVVNARDRLAMLSRETLQAPPQGGAASSDAAAEEAEAAEERRRLQAAKLAAENSHGLRGLRSAGAPGATGAHFDYVVRILLLGDSGVGKTSVMMRYAEDSYHRSLLSTAGVDFKVKRVDIGGLNVRVQIWDTAGQEKFHQITKSYYKNTHGIVLVYDVADGNSYGNVAYWMSNITQHATNHVHKMLLGNKADLPADQRDVDTAQGQAAGEEYGVRFAEVSAKDGSGVVDALSGMVEDIVAGLEAQRREKERLARPPPRARRGIWAMFGCGVVAEVAEPRAAPAPPR